MAENYNLGFASGPLSLASVKARATLAEKERNDFERQKQILDSIDLYYGDYRDYDRINKFKINYDLLNGRLDVKLYEDPLCFSMPGPDGVPQEVSFDFQNMSHTPLIAQFGNAIIGERTGMPFIPTIKDHTPQRGSILKKKANKNIRKYLIEGVINPIRTQIMHEMQKRAGQVDLFAMASTPEEQMQLEQAINAELEAELPRSILEFINGDVQSPTARQAQMMLDYLVDRFDIKYEQIKGFKNAVVTGEEYYFAGEYNGKLFFEAVNPTHLQWGGGDRENEWSQHADWVKRERWLSYQQVISRHATALDGTDLEYLDLEIEPVGGFYDGRQFWDRDNDHTKHFMYTFSRDEGFQEMFSDANYKTIEGRKKLFQAYNYAFHAYGDKYGRNYSDYGIREAHIQFRDLRMFWHVKRMQPNGKYREFFLPEHYEPSHLDEDIKQVWMNQGWEGWKLGTYHKSVYTMIQPIPCQYKSMFNPYDVDLSYYGRKYNTHDNTVDNVALVDLGKSAQKNFDMVLASVRQDMSTTSGRAFTMFMNLMPEGWNYQDWLDLMRNAGILMLDPTRNNAGIDPQFLREINLSKMSDIADKIQLLQFYRSQVALSMFFNDTREGAISEYANATNIQQNSIAVHNKTAFFFEMHRKVVEQALAGLLNRARHWYTDHPHEAAIFLDDVALAELETTPMSAYEHLGVQVMNSEEERQKLERVKIDMISLIQNGATPEAVMELVYADTETEVKDIVRRESARMQKERQEDMQHQQQMNQSQIDARLQEKREELANDMQKHQMLLQSQEQRTLWDREKFMMQNDVDQNQISDLIQKTLIEVQGKMDMHGIDTQVKREEMQLKERLEKARLINDRKQITTTTQNQKSSSK